MSWSTHKHSLLNIVVPFGSLKYSFSSAKFRDTANKWEGVLIDIIMDLSIFKVIVASPCTK